MPKWFIQQQRDELGPLASADLLEEIRKGNVTPSTMIRKDDSQWVPAREVNGLFSAAEKPADQRLCPYCGHAVEKPPTVCGGCRRKLVLSFSSQITEEKKTTSAADKQKQAEERKAEVERIARRSNFREILLYSFLLLVAIIAIVIWYVVMF